MTHTDKEHEHESTKHNTSTRQEDVLSLIKRGMACDVGRECLLSRRRGWEEITRPLGGVPPPKKKKPGGNKVPVEGLGVR